VGVRDRVASAKSEKPDFSSGQTASV
jgi:hypothetical protein